MHFRLTRLKKYQNALLSNQMAKIFDHQYLWKESVSIFFFCKETTTKEFKALKLILLIGSRHVSKTLEVFDHLGHLKDCFKERNCSRFLEKEKIRRTNHLF